MKAVLGIGTNIGDRAENINSAMESLSLVPGIKVLRISDTYETKPWGYTDQPNFYNNVVEIETSLSPAALLGVCLGIEAGMGRVREFKNGPRIIDIDVLVYEGVISDTKELVLPHPRIGERDFVLVPLKELYDDMDVLGISYKKFYQNIVKGSTAHKVEKS
jgi:2-amino-4-hydroxy-6-hydroxymethyldihydropteridine diphosphokinase